ncbi:contact-dependent growth inhibition system immunity protein [Pseudomonas sp. LB3P14]
MNSDVFSHLYQFLGAYFNEDWMCGFESADDVVRSYLLDSSKEAIAGAREEINMLLMQSVGEEQLRDFLLKDMGACYCYWHEWPSGESWLKHVVVLLDGERQGGK